MGMRIFTSLYEGNKGSAIPRWYEKKTQQSSLWAFGLFPFSMEKANAIMAKVQESINRHIDDESTETAFESILKEVNDTLPSLMTPEDMQHLLQQGALLLAFLRDDELYISNFGQGEVFLHRGGKLIEISEGLSPTNVDGEIFQNISNGDIQAGDRIVFSTYRLQRYITERQLAKMLTDGVTEAMDEVSSMIDTAESGSIFLLHSKSDSVFANVSPQESTKKPIWQGKMPNIPNVANMFSASMQHVKRQYARMDKNQMLLAAATLLALFLLVLFFALRSGEHTAKNTGEYAQFIETVQQRFADAEQRYAMGNINEANVILNQIESTAQKMLSERVNVPKAEEILQFAQKKREYINGIMRISNPEVISDFTAIKADIATRGFFPFGNEIITYDNTALYRTLTAGTNIEPLGDIVKNDVLVAGSNFPDKDKAVFLTKGGSVIEWNGTQAVAVDTADTTWKNAKDITTFSKFLYFLDPEQKQIWKYERRESGYTLPEAWISVGNESVKDATSFAIDGNIFVLNNRNEIVKFYRGEKVPYALTGLPEGGISGDVLYTDENLDILLVLNTEESSVYVLNKYDTEAAYEKKIIIENAGKPVDIFANDNRIFVLTTTRIVEIPLL